MLVTIVFAARLAITGAEHIGGMSPDAKKLYLVLFSAL